MLSFDQTLEKLVQSVQPLGSEEIALEAAAGRYLAQDLTARGDAPRSDVSMMDGYAVVEAATHPGEWLDLIGEKRLGSPSPVEVQPERAVRIFTSGPVPSGVDCVIRQEYAQVEGGRVAFCEGFGPARHLRTTGSDFCEDDVLLRAGTRLTPAALVAAAAADRARIKVGVRPRVAIIATGDELVPPGQTYDTAAALPESASLGIAALATAAGGSFAMRKHGAEEIDLLKALTDEALDQADLVVVTGGASIGDHDLAKPMFERQGFELLFSRIAIKPGKPVWFGEVGKKLVLGLPGNPGPAMVTGRLFLQPLLAALQGGAPKDELVFAPVRLATALGHTGNRETFVRAAITIDGLVPAGNQHSDA